jgi:hypothetical protein
MPLLSDFPSDYPLHLTLLERPYAGSLRQSYRTGLPPARATPVSFIGTSWWVLSQPLVDGAFDARHYSGTIGRHFHSVEPRICTGPRTEFCSSARVPSTSESTCGLTHARALVRDFRLNIDKQLAHLVEQCVQVRAATVDPIPTRCRSPWCRQTQHSMRSSRSTCCHIGTSLADKHRSLSGVSNAGPDGRSALRVCHCLARLFVDSRASQVNLGGAHDVSKQRSSKF